MKRSFTKFGRIIFFIGGSLLFYSTSHSQSIARVQLIHNVADPSLATADIYLDDVLLLNDFQFRDATPYTDVSAAFKISIAPSTSASSAEAIHDTTFTFTDASKNVIMVSGVNGTGFQANPGNANMNTSVRFFAAKGTKDISSAPTVTELNIVHGLTDAAPVDILVEGETTMWDNIGYGGYSGYKGVTPGENTLHIVEFTGTNPDTLGTFTADLSLMGGQGVVVFASGFLTPADDNNGPAFGLFAALPDGTVVPLTNVNITALFSTVKSFSGIVAYPVPSAGNLTLEINNDQPGTANIEVMNMYGQLMMEGKDVQLFSGRNEIPLDMSGLNTGEYLIKIVSTERVGAIRCSLQK